MLERVASKAADASAFDHIGRGFDAGTLAVLNQLNTSALAESAGSVEREVRLTLALNPEP